MQETKYLSEEGLEQLRKNEKQKVREKSAYLNAVFQRIERKDKKAFLSDQCKEIEENNRMEKIVIHGVAKSQT